MNMYLPEDNSTVEAKALPPTISVATCSIKAAGGSIVATAKLVGKDGVDACKISLSIQRKTASKWISVESWTVTKDARVASVEGKLDSAQRGTYRAKADMIATVSGESVSVAKISNTVTV